MKLTTAEITGVYDEIGKMRVQLDPDPNKGLQYVKERLTLCRAMQDRLGELLLRCSRSYSEVLAEELSVKTEKQLSPPPPDTTIMAQRLSRIAADKEEHATLVKMLRLQHTLLGRTSQDIRLLADLTKEQIKLGEINPHEAGLVENVPVEDLSPVPHVPPVDLDADQSSTLGPPSAIIEEMNAVVALPQFPGPDLPVMTTEPVTDYDELFGALNGKHSSDEHP